MVDAFFAVLDLSALEVELLGDVVPRDVDTRVEAAFAEDVDQHRQRRRFLEDDVLAVDVGVAADRVPPHDGH